tara:strand:- start:134 stop:244 length:111 start_codon:yes stop_codon:yes gene_type:complete
MCDPALRTVNTGAACGGIVVFVIALFIFQAPDVRLS